MANLYPLKTLLVGHGLSILMKRHVWLKKSPAKQHAVFVDGWISQPPVFWVGKSPRLWWWMTMMLMVMAVRSWSPAADGRDKFGWADSSRDPPRYGWQGTPTLVRSTCCPHICRGFLSHRPPTKMVGLTIRCIGWFAGSPMAWKASMMGFTSDQVNSDRDSFRHCTRKAIGELSIIVHSCASAQIAGQSILGYFTIEKDTPIWKTKARREDTGINKHVQNKSMHDTVCACAPV